MNNMKVTIEADTMDALADALLAAGAALKGSAPKKDDAPKKKKAAAKKPAKPKQPEPDPDPEIPPETEPEPSELDTNAVKAAFAKLAGDDYDAAAAILEKVGVATFGDAIKAGVVGQVNALLVEGGHA